MAEVALKTKQKNNSKAVEGTPRSAKKTSQQVVKGSQAKNSQPAAQPSQPAGAFYSAAPVVNLTAPVQAKLTIGKANDPYEREADTVASKVINAEPVPSITPVPATGINSVARMESSEEESEPPPVQTRLIQRMGEGEEQPEQTTVQPQLIQRASDEESEQPPVQTRLIQRMGEAEELPEETTVQPQLIQRASEEESEQPTTQTKLIQRKEMSSSPMTNAASDAIKNSGAGEPLNSPIRKLLETRMSVDLSDVRIHQDSKATESTRALKARAFASQNHIWLGSNESQSDVSLMAHETTHVLQQTGSIHRKLIQRDTSSQDKSGEKLPTEAEKAVALAAARIAQKEAAQSAAKGREEVTKSKAKEAIEKEASKVAKQETILTDGKTQAIVEEVSTKLESNQQDKTEGKQKNAKSKGSHKVDKKTTGDTDVSKGKQDKAPTSAAEDPAFQAVIGKVKGVTKQQSKHDTAKSKADAAQDSAESPSSELEGKAQATNVGKMEEADTPAFNAAAFKAQLMERIQALAPKTVEEADDLKKDDKLGGLKGDMQSKVADEKAASQAPVAEKTAASPDASIEQPKPVTPLAAADPGASPTAVGAKAAVPKAKGQSELETPFAESSNKIDSQMADAGINEEQLQKSNEPAFQGALDAKSEAQTNATEGPQGYRSFEQEQVSQAEGEATAVARARTQGMHADRTGLLNQVEGQQGQTKTKDVQARDKIAVDIGKIYQSTKINVETILNEIDGKVSTVFDAGSEAAKKTFEDYVDSEMTAYKEERYGGFFGWARWTKDKLLGMPAKVNAFYRDGRQLYLNEMDAVIDNVVALIGTELTKAKAEIATGKKDIQDYVNKLPDNLKTVGQEASEDIQSKFDQLEQSVNNKQNELINTLANKYQENLKAVDARIDELKAANEGLVDKAINAVVGVIKTIIEIKNLLLKVLSKISDVITDILGDPIGFLGNLISGLKQGFVNFVDNIAKHMQTGLISWLTGSLGSMGIQMPEDLFSLKGIFSLVMQVLGMSWDFIRRKAVKLMGEPVIKFLETAFEPFKILITEGVGGLWKYVKEQFSDLKKMVMEQIKSMVIIQVIKAGIKWLLGLLNPAAAFIKAATTIYEIIKFLWERAKQILEFIEAVVDAVAAIAKGSISGAAKLIENALAKALPLVIGFLASLLGLGGLAKKVQDFLKSLRKKFSRVVDKLLVKAKKMAHKLMGKIGLGKKADKPKGHADKERVLRQAVNEVKKFTAKPGASITELQKILPRIKSQYGLTKLEVLGGDGSTPKIYAEINPSITLPLPSLAVGDVAVQGKLKLLSIKPNDVVKIIASLESTGGGDAVGAHIKSGSFDSMLGYKQVLHNIKQKSEVPSVLQALNKGRQLLGHPRINTVQFEQKKTGFPSYDIDVASVDPKGKWSSVYQLKTAESLQSLKPAAFKAKNQIKQAEANKRWVEIVVLNGSRADFDSYKRQNDSKLLPDTIKDFWPSDIGLRVIFDDGGRWVING